MLFQSLIVDVMQSGYMGQSLHGFLNPLIGKAGMWLFLVLLLMMASSLLLNELPNLEMINRFSNKLIYGSVDSFKELLVDVKNIIFENESSVKEKPKAPPPAIIEKVEDKKEESKEDEKSVEPSVIEEKKPKGIINKKPKEIAFDKKRKALFESSDDAVIVETPIHKEGVHKMGVIIDDTKEEEQEVNVVQSHPEVLDTLLENEALMNDIEKGEMKKPENFILPPLDFLQQAPKNLKKVSEAEVDKKMELLLSKLKQFKIEGDIDRTYSGPFVTTFEFSPREDIKVSRILNLQDDLAMALSAQTIRIQAPIPGKNVVGIEIPNDVFDTIYLRSILEDEIFLTAKSPLTIALGKDIVGKPFITDLKRLPHLLIAGTTGSGKSVGINAMILSLLYRNDPDNLKLLLIDPKMLEFSIYNDIPHLLTPVITEAKQAITALNNMVSEMEIRYRLMANSRTKNIENYNEKMTKLGEQTMPYIVVVIDELADLMMTGGKEVEFSIARLAQMARASGIHLIVATQRPSVDIVTGLIKANLPARLSYRVNQKIDSKVILDSMGAESLLGRGDALFTPPASNGIVRLHAPWNSEDEIELIVEFLKEQREPEYDENFLLSGDERTIVSGSFNGERDEFYEQAKEIILSDRKTSISYLQRKLGIGYNRSANIIEQLEQMGVLSEVNSKGAREILL
jgi:S-DNA-T family DNA segregation ATPase FtsK/SpoIIIE